jgi:uncharacterized protein
MLTIREIKALSLPACKKFGVLRLDIFGSFAKDSANDKSDLDFLVEFENPDDRAAKRFFGLLHYFEDTFQRSVDLLTFDSLRNPYLRKQILLERNHIYEG